MATSLHDSYDAHPLNAAAIGARLARQGRHAPTELDLALDPETAITDQNHVGCLANVIQLAELLRVTAGSRVCDIGGGLGGSARSLAFLFGCHVHVVDVHESRCRDARELTELVGLTRLVSIEHADATVSRSNGQFDLLWGQSAWIHFEDLAGVLALWSPSLVPRARAACEDAFLRRPPEAAETGAVEELQRIWNCRLSTGLHWQNQFERGGFTVDLFHDLTFQLETHFQCLLRSGQNPNARERRGWELALVLAKAGLLGYGRWAATRRDR